MTVSLVSIKATVRASGKASANPIPASQNSVKVLTALSVTDAIPVAAALAVLVADGASPTQAHVNTLNSAYTTLAADIAAADTGAGTVQTAAGHSVVVTFDVTDISDWGKLEEAFRACKFQAIAAGYLKP